MSEDDAMTAYRELAKDGPWLPELPFGEDGIPRQRQSIWLRNARGDSLAIEEADAAALVNSLGDLQTMDDRAFGGRPMFGIAAIRARDIDFATLVPGSGLSRWSHDRLSDAYRMAGIDRHWLLSVEFPELRAALVSAFEAMDAACKWAAHETAGVKTVADADRHMAGYDALLDATVKAGQVLNLNAILAALGAEPEEGS